MRNSTLTKLLGTALLTSIGATASAASMPKAGCLQNAPLSRMRKVMPTQKWSNTEIAGHRQKRVSPDFTTPTVDEFQYMIAPDGSEWYAVCDYDYEEVKYDYYTEKYLKGFTFTIYDSKFNEVGKVRDKIEFEEGETRCAQVMLDVNMTKKFFNNDDKPEVMVSFSMNTGAPNYYVNVRTKAYSVVSNLGDEELSTPLATINGYPIDAVNCAQDRWSEEFYITFLTDERPENVDDYDTYTDYLGDFYSILTTYGKGSNTIMQRRAQNLKLPGDQMTSPLLLCKNQGGKLTLIYAEYEKSFFEDPSGMGENETVIPDNKLIIDVYQMNDAYPREMELISTTKIDAVQNTDNSDVYCTYYGIGNLMWDKDVDFGNYTSDGRPAFIVSTDDYLYSDDDHYNSGYFVYDADGKRIKTIAENTYDYVQLSDVPGYEPQAMFVHMGDDMNFEFVDLYSASTVTEVDHMFRGHSLTTSVDRVPTAGGYSYAFALAYGTALDDTNIASPICWIDTNGELIRVDEVPVGEGVELVQNYMSADALTPFVFNTDSAIEYVMLVKRRMPGDEGLREELVIASPEKGVLHTFTADEAKGYLRTVFLMAGADPQLLIVYMDDDYRFTTDAYSLPFSRFAGGSGSLADPYLIATAGDLQQIKFAPKANYRLTGDIDCGSLTYYIIDEFSGVLDGDGHTVSNLRLCTQGTQKTGLFSYTNNATVKNIDFYNASMLLSGSYEAGLIAATASQTTFDNIHVRRFSATGDDYRGEFGGIAGKTWMATNLKGCELAGAEIDLPSCPVAGGMTGDIRTGTTITGCAFSGNMTTNNTLGGIVGSTTTGDEVISQCHVDANLKAQNTVGGIVGFLDRSKVRSNYVEGTLEATTPSKWTNALSLGAIAGELEGDWQGNADVPVVNNLIGVSALIYPSLDGVQAQHPRQLATVHRVVGRTSYNSYKEEEPNWVAYETGVLNNLVVSDLAVIDSDFNETSIEGTTTDKYELDTDILEKNLQFAFGQTSDAPWNLLSWYAYDPSLYYESSVYIPASSISVNKDETFSIEIAILSKEQITEDDILDGFMCEYDADVIEMTGNMTFDGKTMSVEFTAIAAGATDFSVSILGSNAGCKVTVNGDGNAVDSIAAEGGKLSIESGIVAADGCAITVFDINGKAILSGFDSVDASALSAGIYVAVATDKAGKTSALKFAR